MDIFYKRWLDKLRHFWWRLRYFLWALAVGAGVILIVLVYQGFFLSALLVNQLATEKAQKLEEVFVPVHYATDRTVTGKTEPNYYYGSDRGELRYGRALVSIPDFHVMGRMERPTIWKFELSEDPKNHVVLRALAELDADQFFASLATEVMRLQDKTTFVFIHGFKVTFSEAARRTAQMAYDLFS